MKVISLSEEGVSFEAHLVKDTAYVYVDDVYTDMYYIDNVEELENPTELILREIELWSKPSQYKTVNLF